MFILTTDWTGDSTLRLSRQKRLYFLRKLRSFRCASKCCTSFISLLLPIQFSLQLSAGGVASGPETPRYFTKSLRRLAPQGGCGEKNAVQTADLSFTLFIRHNLS